MGIITDTILNTQESAIQPSKYDEALAKYDTNLDDNAVRDAVRKIIAEKVHENDTMEVKRFLFGSIELTSLKTTDSEESILAFTERVNDFDSHYPDLPHVATICVYPCFADIVAESLEVDGVEIACVSGSFPSSQARIEVKVAETSLAVADGATEIDIVMPVGKFLSGDYEGVCDEIQELKAACGEEVPMKVILETGALKTATNIKKASILAMYAGADYIKTSTGFAGGGATREDVALMAAHMTNGKKIKAAGGIASLQDAEDFLKLGADRLGTSRIVKAVKELEAKGEL